MGNNLYLIIALQMLVLCILVILILLLQNRRLRRQKSRGRAIPQEGATKEAATTVPATYQDRLAHQIALTKAHHDSLGAHQNIALDLDPETPLPRRTAALRHALLIAETEAVAHQENDSVQWDRLSTRYQQLFAFQADYQTDGDQQVTTEEIRQLKERLRHFKVLNLEFYQYWKNCENQLKHLSELTSLAEEDSDSDLTKALDNYQAAYKDLGEIIERGAASLGIDKHLDQ